MKAWKPSAILLSTILLVLILINHSNAASASTSKAKAVPTARRKTGHASVKPPGPPSSMKKPPVVGLKKMAKGSKDGLPISRLIDEEESTGLLEEAIKAGSLHKYINADPLWTAQLTASVLGWIVVVAFSSTASMDYRRNVLAIMAVRHGIGLLSDIRHVVQEAAEGDVDRSKIRKLARGLTAVPGAPSYLLYTAALLTLPHSISPSLTPLLLREFFTFIAVGLDLLQIIGVSSEAASGRKAAPRRLMPASLSSISFGIETFVGVSLLIAVIRGGTKGNLTRRLVALLLYTNFLMNRAGHFAGFKGHFAKKNVVGMLGALLGPIVQDLEPATRQITLLSRASLAKLDTSGQGGGVIRSVLTLLGFLEEDDKTKETADEPPGSGSADGGTEQGGDDDDEEEEEQEQEGGEED